MNFLKKILAYISNLVSQSQTKKTQQADKPQNTAEETIESAKTDVSTPSDALIGHHANLVDNLKSDHQHLLKLYTDMLNDAQGLETAS